jgi:hypothetical protein
VEVVTPMSQHSPFVHNDDGSRVVLSSFWTVSRGAQVINCEFIVPGHGQPIVRCACGPHAVIRSQVIASEDAAAAVSEIWKAALLEQGFQVEFSRSDS